MEVIVLGSINMDLVISTDTFPKQGETVIGQDFFLSHGGKGANQATAIGKLGVKPKFVGCVGNDIYGKDSLDVMKENNIDITDIQVLDDYPTGVAMIILHEGDNRIIINPGANHQIKLESVKKAISKAPSNSIFLCQFENNISAIEYGIKYAKEKGLYTIVNPAPFIEIDIETYKYVDLLVLNQSELNSLIKNTSSDDLKIEEACKTIQKLGVKTIIVTVGSKGSYIYEDDLLLHVPSFKVKAIDTTCAGDSFLGALINKLIEKETLLEAVGFASKIAAITVSRQGAQVAIPNSAEYQEYLEKGFFD